MNKEFVEGGFEVPESKCRISYHSRDVMLVGTNVLGDEQDLTESGCVVHGGVDACWWCGAWWCWCMPVVWCMLVLVHAGGVVHAAVRACRWCVACCCSCMSVVWCMLLLLHISGVYS